MNTTTVTQYTCSSCDKRPNLFFVINDLSSEYYLVCPHCGTVFITKTNIFKTNKKGVDFYKHDSPISATHEQVIRQESFNRMFTYQNYQIMINTVKRNTLFMPLKEIIFYNKEGEAIAYSEDASRIYLFNGRAVGVFIRGSIYNYMGKPLGWYIDHWVRDNKGFYVFFTDFSEGGLAKPGKHLPSQKLKKNPKHFPQKIYPRKQVVIQTNLIWSNFSNIDFFNQYFENFHG